MVEPDGNGDGGAAATSLASIIDGYSNISQQPPQRCPVDDAALTLATSQSPRHGLDSELVLRQPGETSMMSCLELFTGSDAVAMQSEITQQALYAFISSSVHYSMLC